jgi:hypothetical protein
MLCNYLNSNDISPASGILPQSDTGRVQGRKPIWAAPRECRKLNAVAGTPLQPILGGARLPSCGVEAGTCRMAAGEDVQRQRRDRRRAKPSHRQSGGVAASRFGEGGLRRRRKRRAFAVQVPFAACARR